MCLTLKLITRKRKPKGKFERRSQLRIFLGYNYTLSKVYRIHDPIPRKIIVSHDVKFMK